MPQDWEAMYRQAMVETNQHQLIGKIDFAVPVLRTCLQELDLHRNASPRGNHVRCLAYSGHDSSHRTQDSGLTVQDSLYRTARNQVRG